MYRTMRDEHSDESGYDTAEVERAAEDLRVGIIDDDALTLAALRSVVNGMAPRHGTVVIWTSRSGDEAVDLCVDRRSRPDVVLVDMNMDGVDGGMVCQRIRHFSDRIVIYGMTAHSLRRYEHVTRRFGAQALLDKADVQGLQRCLADCAAGRTYIQQGFSSPGQAYRLLTVPGAVNATSLELSPRETEVLDWTIEGLTAKEVAARMALSEATVKTHLRHAIRKRGVGNKLQLIRVWTQFRSA